MSGLSVPVDFADVEVPMDAWSEPFWAATDGKELRFCKCAQCGLFRWPPGPFCPDCHAQAVDWVPAGRASVYTFTLLPSLDEQGSAAGRQIAPAIIEFDGAPGIRLLSTIVGAPVDHIAIGDEVEVDWIEAANATVPVFRLV